MCDAKFAKVCGAKFGKVCGAKFGKVCGVCTTIAITLVLMVIGWR
ncbi:hypothetical protein HMPREF9075_01226 [Capnocytophaga sp. oral taxon 332 str. F0381]|nr:hypothetical protein HMPREF9075_01226 [Capnocytophaga sp. oral taxon 332 str. F0381]